MTSEALSLDRVVGEAYSRPEVLFEDPFLSYLRTAYIPVLCEGQRAQPFPLHSASSKAGDAVVALIGKMHAAGVILKRLEDESPYDSIKQREETVPYFAIAGRRAVVAVPDVFVRVDATYLHKYFGNTVENPPQLYRGICRELFFDLSGGLGRFVDPTPEEEYQNTERARRANIYLKAFRRACPFKDFATLYVASLRKSAFPQFKDSTHNPFPVR